MQKVKQSFFTAMLATAIGFSILGYMAGAHSVEAYEPHMEATVFDDGCTKSEATDTRGFCECITDSDCVSKYGGE